MVTRSEAKYIRVSATKVRPIINLIKGLNPEAALSKLEFVNKKGSLFLKKLIKTALSDAANKGYQKETLFISKMIANQGPALKRYRAASFGRASVVKKRMCHLLIELDSTEKILTEQ